MKSDPDDKLWQELQARLERVHRRYLGSEAQATEYKPGEMLQMFEMPSKYGETNWK